jgi:mRNA interferase HigB
MHIHGIGILQDFWTIHRDAESPLRVWIEVVSGAVWLNFVECRRTFGSADQVKLRTGVVTIFNIKGNKYRLIAAVSYPLGLLVVRRILTHKEYSQERWKDQ